MKDVLRFRFVFILRLLVEDVVLGRGKLYVKARHAEYSSGDANLGLEGTRWMSIYLEIGSLGQFGAHIRMQMSDNGPFREATLPVSEDAPERKQQRREEVP